MARPDRRTALGAMVAVAVVVAAAVVWWAAAASSATPSCRDLVDPSRVLPLSKGAVRDLRSDDSRLDAGDLSTPARDEVEQALSRMPRPRGRTWVCRWRGPGQVALISRSKEEDNSLRCYGPAEACADMQVLPKVWVTCYSASDVASGRTVLRGGCIRAHE